MAIQQFCTFVVDEALFGVEVERVQEILRHQEMTRADRDLADAHKATKASQRFEDFNKVDRELDSAVKKIEEMQKANQKLAQERLDQMKLENLADRQQQLADKAAELAKTDPASQG